MVKFTEKVTKFDCEVCGNKDPKAVYEYDGSLGYEALICKKCGTYYDEQGMHKADDWSSEFMDYDNSDKKGKSKITKVQELLNIIEAGEGGMGVGGSAGGGGGAGTGSPGINALGRIPMGPLRKRVKVKYNGKYKQFTEYKSSVMDDIETYIKEQGFNYDRPFKGEGIHDRIWVNQGDREFILSPERVSNFDSLDDVFTYLKKELKIIKSGK